MRFVPQESGPLCSDQDSTGTPALPNLVFMTNFDYRREIRNEYEQRKVRNGSYSLRAYARDLKISSTALHGVLGGTRHLSSQNLSRVAEKLAWSPEQCQRAQAFIEGSVVVPSAKEIFDHDRFRMISDWFYLPILNLPQLGQHRAEPSWIAKRLGIPLEVAGEALERLKRLGFLKEYRGRLRRLIGGIGTTEDISDAAKINYHSQVLQKAREKYIETPPEMREYLTMTIPLDTKKMGQLKALIRSFREDFLKQTDCKNADEIYQLSIQFFPVSESVVDGENGTSEGPGASSGDEEIAP